MEMPRYLGVTGTSEPITDAQRRQLFPVLRSFRDQGFDWMRNGDCINADHELARVWRQMGGKVFGHPPLSPVKRAFFNFDEWSIERGYLDRNRDIVYGSEELLGVPSGPEKVRSGTWSTIRLARSLGRKITLIWPTGRVTIEHLATGSNPNGEV